MGRFGRTLFLGGAVGLATLTPWQTPWWPVVQCEGVVSQPVSESAKVKDVGKGSWDDVVLKLLVSGSFCWFVVVSNRPGSECCVNRCVILQVWRQKFHPHEECKIRMWFQRYI